MQKIWCYFVKKIPLEIPFKMVHTMTQTQVSMPLSSLVYHLNKFMNPIVSKLMLQIEHCSHVNVLKVYSLRLTN